MDEAVERMSQGIRILERTSFKGGFAEGCERELAGFVTIGSGEIRITVLDDEGSDMLGWIAAIGWTSLIHGEQDIKQSDAPILTEAAGLALYRILDTIFARTLDKHAAVKKINIAAPCWMHDLIAANVMTVRERVSPVVLETVV